MNDRCLVARWNILRKPLDQLFHFRNVHRFRCLVLFGPAMDLAGNIIPFLAKPFEPRLLPVHIVQVGEGLQLGFIDLAAHRGLIIGERTVPEDAALNHVHYVEDRADDIFVHAKAIRPRNRITEGIQRIDDTEFTVDGVRARQEIAGRLAAHDIFLAGRDQLVGRVGLAALELAHLQRAFITFNIGLHPASQTGLVELV